MDQNVYPGPKTLDAELIQLAGTIAVGSDGTPTASIEGVASTSRVSAGKIKVTLDESYAGGLKAAALGVTGPFEADRETDSSTTSDPHVDIETRDKQQIEGLLAGAPTSASAQTTGAAETAWRVNLAAGIVDVAGVKKEFAAEADRVIHDTTELVENGESAIAAIVAKNVSGTITLVNVKGAAATTGAQVAPTDAEIDTAVSSVPWVKLCECTVNRTADTTLTQSQDNAKRPLAGSLADAKDQTIDVLLVLQRRSFA